MVLYNQALTSVWQVKIPLYFPYTGIAAVLQPRTLPSREDINLNYITRSLILVLILLMSACIKHKLSETRPVKISRINFCLHCSFWFLNEDIFSMQTASF